MMVWKNGVICCVSMLRGPRRSGRGCWASRLPGGLPSERGRSLSDPTRLMLAAALREGGELCVCDLAWISGRAQNLVWHHLRLLRSHGLVTSRRDGKLVMYSLTGEGRSLLGAVLGEGAMIP
jgi:DNA-binding transcriptional ArsR family regulator